MDIALLGGGVFALAVIVIADRIDDIVDAFSSSDDPLTDFDADLDAEGETDDSPDPLEDA
ncbi:hypothetical protein BRC92_12375 [Halobacteriales archaeon QS_4_69_31]|jgi:hypothetical protein|nr:MAG: hypothetical protein BRC92_12375 [Halobacteriales archaeon QS_4_69_31]